MDLRHVQVHVAVLVDGEQVLLIPRRAPSSPEAGPSYSKDAGQEANAEVGPSERGGAEGGPARLMGRVQNPQPHTLINAKP